MLPSPTRSPPPKFECLLLPFLAAMAIVRLLGVVEIPLSPDEAYYWQWTRPLQLSYFDHPPMVAYWIWLGTRLAGDTVFGIRLLAFVANALTSLILWDTARRIFRSRNAAAVAVVALNSALLFNVDGVLVTPDNPLLLFWMSTLWCLARFLEATDVRYLLLAGLAGGLACLSKYTGLFLVPGILLTFLSFKQLRSWLLRPQLYLSAIIGAVCGIPVLVWNAQHNWASFSKQFDHAFVNIPSSPGPVSVARFVGSQAGIMSPGLFVLTVLAMSWALWAGWRKRQPALFLLGATSLPMLAFFTIHAAGTTVQAHWAGPAYLGGLVAMAGFVCERHDEQRWWIVASLGAGIVLTVATILHGAFGLVPLPMRMDPLKRIAGWPDLAAAVAAQRAADPALFLFTDKHEPTGILTFLLSDHPLVFLQGPIRPSYYGAADLDALKGRDGLFITRSRSDDSRLIAKFFDTVEPRGRVALRWRGQEADAYNLYLAKGYKGGAFAGE